MENRRKLEWVQRNRQVKQRSKHIGTITTELVGRIQREGFESVMKAAEVIAECVDKEFRDHCRIAGLQNRKLTIYVDEPAMVSVMQRRWSSNILEKVKLVLGRGSLTKIIFRFGREGVYIRPTTQRET